MEKISSNKESLKSHWKPPPKAVEKHERGNVVAADDPLGELVKKLYIFLSTRWAILLSLYVDMFCVNKYPDIFQTVAKLNCELGKELELYYNLLVLVYLDIRQWQFSGNIKLTFG
ncbi:hypothetical protein JHK86_040030 [Glycine max]|nr:hypothetical protein JHK86_040030 [Glycine max]